MAERMLVFQEHGEVLPHWFERGFSRASLVMFDEHLDFKFIPESRLVPLLAEFQAGERPRGRDSALASRKDHGYGFDDFLYAAWRLGLLGRLHWVIPCPQQHRAASPGALLWSQLETVQGLGHRAMETWESGPGWAQVQLDGLQISVSSRVELTRRIPSGPWRLDLDLDYFESYFPAVELELNPVADTLEDLGLTLETACLSIANGFLRPEGRQLATWLANRFQLRKHTSRPTRLAPPLSQGLRLLRAGPMAPGTVMEFEPGLLMCGIMGIRLAALLHTRAGSLARARALIERIEAQGEEATWPRFHLGLALLEAGAPADAEASFRGGEGSMEDALEVRCRILRMICLGKMGSWALVLPLASGTAQQFPMLRQAQVLGALACQALGLHAQERRFRAESQRLARLALTA